MNFKYSPFLLNLSLAYYDPIKKPSPVGSPAELSRALHRYHRGQDLNPGKLEFFSGFLFATAEPLRL